MSDFSVANFSSDESGLVLGQGFTPNIPGPDGTGSPGSATQVYIKSVSLGYGSGNISGRASNVYIYGVELTDPDQIGKPQYLVATNDANTPVDGTGLFGTGTYQRTFSFSAGALDPTQTYYAYFNHQQNIRVQDGSPYSGGSTYDTDLDVIDGVALQFQVEMYTS